MLLADEPLTLEELLAEGGLTNTNARTVRRRLDELVEHDLALRTGEGKRLDPFRWALSENGRFFRDSLEIGLSRKPDGDPDDPSVHADNSPSGFVTDSPTPRGAGGCHESAQSPSETHECVLHGGRHRVVSRAAGFAFLACGCRLQEEL